MCLRLASRIGGFSSKFRCFSTSKKYHDKYSCKLLVVGAGSGGCAVSAKFSKCLSKNELIVLDGSDYHYYQPLFTLIGGGCASFEESRRKQSDVLPQNLTWIKDDAVAFEPKNNIVRTKKGHEISYDYLLTAVGLQLKYEMIPGLVEALNMPASGVCSNYSPKYVRKTYDTLQNLKNGNAIFTFPNSPVKCPGAPQKIVYLSDCFLRKRNRRKDITVIYNTSLPVIFGVKKYADALWKVCGERNIKVNLRTNLIAIDNDKKEAVFQNLDKPDNKFNVKFSMLHVTPPMTTPDCIKTNKDLTNEGGFVEVNPSTLQHVKFPNIFAIGDCGSTPNSKTAAAAAAQSPIVFKNLCSVMKGETPKCKYDGYASCPIVTGNDKCILAEFDYNLEPLETFPIPQDRELHSMYLMKKHLMPTLYWKLMCKGYWNGPAILRKLMHLNFNK